MADNTDPEIHLAVLLLPVLLILLGGIVGYVLAT